MHSWISMLLLAQEVADPAVGAGWSTAFTLYALGGTLLVGGVGWALKKLTDLLGVKIENETISGILGRLIGSVTDAVAMVDQTLRKEIEAAKSPSSPGGEKITESEAKSMKDAVWAVLKSEYGGWEGMFGLLKRIGIGDEAAATEKIDTLIESAVNANKMRKAVTAGPQ